MKDTSILKIVVLIVGAVEILAMAGIVYLVGQDRPVPGTLETVSVAGLTGLLGLLAPSRAATDPNT